MFRQIKKKFIKTIRVLNKISSMKSFIANTSTDIVCSMKICTLCNMPHTPLVVQTANKGKRQQ